MVGGQGPRSLRHIGAQPGEHRQVGDQEGARLLRAATLEHEEALEGGLIARIHRQTVVRLRRKRDDLATADRRGGHLDEAPGAILPGGRHQRRIAKKTPPRVVIAITVNPGSRALPASARPQRRQIGLELDSGLG